MARTSAILTDVSDGTATIRFNQPAARNPLSSTTLNELTNAVSLLTARKDLKVIIFTGADDVFASGADIRELAQLDAERAFEFAGFGQKLFQTIADATQVTIAAINGYCMGGGLDLALACDLRIASPQAVFRHPGARLGIITGWGGTQRLPRLIGRTRALDLLLSARLMNSQEALKVGLITDLVATPLDAAIRLAETMDGKPD
ncbi:MAG: enoyl-CoA hydratase/isomerase family protein [Blastocatellia bacterium]|nr:enoyl-CoA hydratase/isomerase family protein [Blastocatellia bacterium]